MVFYPNTLHWSLSPLLFYVTLCYEHIFPEYLPVLQAPEQMAR